MKSFLMWFSIGIILFGCLGAGTLFLLCAGIVYPVEFVFTLATGWFTFLYRVVPQVETDNGAIILGCSAFAIFVVGLHGLLRSFCATYRRRDLDSLVATHDTWGARIDGAESTTNGHWRFRWTISAATIVLLMFVAGIAVVGITHQTIWLLTSPEPLVVHSRSYLRSDNLRQLGIATHTYEEQKETLPPGMTIDAEGRQLHSWLTLILPMCELRPLFDRVKLSRPWDDPAQGAVFTTQLECYQSPRVPQDTDAQGRALAHYSGNVHVLGGTAVRKTSDITDGATSTILAGEAGGDYVAWGKPGNWRDPMQGVNQSRAGFGDPREHGALFVFADGRVQMLTKQTSPEVLRALSTPAGGEVVPEY